VAPPATDTSPGDAVAIVTGGSRGIGREMARKLADRGYAIVIVYVRDQGLAEAAFGSVDVVVHTAVRGTSVVNEQAALALRRGGAIVNVSSSEAISPSVTHELRARDITVNGLAPGLEPPGAGHDSADLLRLLDRWRRNPGLTTERTDP
jgi:3-oxoacyl-[acyl-carrier protein] reductase